MSEYILITMHKILLFPGHRRPQHFEAVFAILLGLPRVMAHEVHGGVGEGAHGGANEVERAVEKEALGYGGFRSFLYFEEGGDCRLVWTLR